MVTFLEPISKVVTVSCFFGTSGYTLSSSSAVPVYDAGFDITSPEQQEFLLNVRKRHRANFPLAHDAAAPFLITIFEN